MAPFTHVKIVKIVTAAGRKMKRVAAIHVMLRTPPWRCLSTRIGIVAIGGNIIMRRSNRGRSMTMRNEGLCDHHRCH